MPFQKFIRRMIILWAVTLLGIATLTVTSDMLFSNAVIHARSYSSVIDLAGRQRTLSQQIALFSVQYLEADSAESQSRYRGLLRNTVTRMRDDYDELAVSLSDHPPFQTLHGGSVMPARSIYSRYWNAAEDLVALADDDFAASAVPYRYILENAQTVVMLADRTVQLVLDENVAATAQLGHINDIRTLIVLGLVVAQILFVLVPSISRIGSRGAMLEREIVEHEQTQADLAASEARFRSLVESAPVGIVQLDLAGSIEWANERWSQISGFPRDATVGREWATLIHPDDRATMVQVGWAMAAEAKSVEYEVRLISSEHVVTIQGETIPMFDGAGQTTGYLGTVVDITQRKLAEQQTLKLEAERQRMKVLGEFIRDTSHDLRTPLSVIRSGLYLCSRTTDVERIHAKVAVMDEHVSYLNSTIDKLQEMAVLDTMTDLTLVPADASLLLREAMVNLSEQAAAAGIEASLDLEPDLPKILAAPDKLIQAIRAVLDNAVRFSKNGGHVILSGRGMGDRLRIAIEDDGIGMTQTQSTRVFDRFYKVEAARGVGGAGLGLAIAKRVIDLHGGKISLKSEPDIGTTVTIDLPLIPTLKRMPVTA